MHLAFFFEKMTILFLTRTATRTGARIVSTQRFLSTMTEAGPIDLEHYTSGWNIEDIGDFTKPGKYNIETYNKISPVVRRN